MIFGSAGMSLGGADEPVVERCMAPRKKRRTENHTTPPVESELKLELEGLYGYVYIIKYYAGIVKLCVGEEFDGESDSSNMCLSVKDWRLFRTSVCADLNQPGFPESMYVAQWVCASSPVIYRVEADRFLRPQDEFIFFRKCEDLEGIMSARGRSEWHQHPYPITVEESDNWFKNVFFIQWCDWRSMQKLFSDIDKAIQKDRVYTSYEAVRKRLFLSDNKTGMQTGLSSLQCLSLPKIIQHPDY